SGAEVFFGDDLRSTAKRRGDRVAKVCRAAGKGADPASTRRRVGAKRGCSQLELESALQGGAQLIIEDGRLCPEIMQLRVVLGSQAKRVTAPSFIDHRRAEIDEGSRIARARVVVAI